jgi:hypothetical protein
VDVLAAQVVAGTRRADTAATVLLVADGARVAVRTGEARRCAGAAGRWRRFPGGCAEQQEEREQEGGGE